MLALVSGADSQARRLRLRESWSLAELQELVGTLVAKVAELGAANATLQTENRALRDEVAQLKGSRGGRPAHALGTFRR